MTYLILIIYLLIGFQIGTRTFYWDYNRGKGIMPFIINLIILPFIWPYIFILSLFPFMVGCHKALWHWNE